MNFKDFFQKKEKMNAKMWREIFFNKEKAKEALVNLWIPNDNGRLRKVEFVTLASGTKIKVEDVSEEQAHEFMKELCPKHLDMMN
jgi:hypothetical protein